MSDDVFPVSLSAEHVDQFLSHVNDRSVCVYLRADIEITSFEPTESDPEDNQSDHRDQLPGIDLCSDHGLSRMERILLFY